MGLREADRKEGEVGLIDCVAVLVPERRSVFHGERRQ